MVKRRNPLRVEEEKENVPLLITTKVVEYLEPVMSRELLCKFPDNSGLGFDYSQSSLWSPLVPRTCIRPTDHDSATLRDLTSEFGEFGEEKNTETKQRKMKKKKKKKFMGFDVSAMKKKKMMVKKAKMGSGFSANPLKVGCFGITTKGLDEMLKAASKRFKKTKKRDPRVHLSNYIKFPQT